jgi:PAS domain S-box-containing protein
MSEEHSPAMGAGPAETPARFADRVAGAILSMRSDAIVAADRDGTIRLWNPGAERIFGHSRDEALGHSLDLIIPERLRPRHWAGYMRTMQTGSTRYGEADLLSVPAVCKDGTTISIQFTIVPLRDSERTIGLAAIIRNVTSQYQEMRELKRALGERGGAAANNPSR